MPGDLHQSYASLPHISCNVGANDTLNGLPEDVAAPLWPTCFVDPDTGGIPAATDAPHPVPMASHTMIDPVPDVDASLPPATGLYHSNGVDIMVDPVMDAATHVGVHGALEALIASFA